MEEREMNIKIKAVGNSRKYMTKWGPKEATQVTFEDSDGAETVAEVPHNVGNTPKTGEVLHGVLSATPFGLRFKKTPPPDVQKEGASVPFKEAPEPSKTEKAEPDWEAISRGKVRHGVSVAMIQSGHKSLTPELAGEILQWEEFIITGDPDAVIDTDKMDKEVK